MYKGTITVDDEAPINGTCVTPVWIGIHDGVFDTYNGNEPLPDFMESLVEDGASGPLVAAFAADDGGVWDGGVGMGPICPGEEATLNFEFEEAAAGTKLFVSYASMILPSNDAWVGNGNPMQYPIIDESGAFMPVTIDVAGTAVLDGGTEVNDEIRANTVREYYALRGFLLISCYISNIISFIRFLFVGILWSNGAQYWR